MNHLSHWIAASSIIPTGTTLCHLIRPIFVFVFRRFLSDYLDRVYVSTLQFTSAQLPALGTELKHLPGADVAAVFLFIFLADILNRSKERGSKIVMARVTNGLSEFPTWQILRTYEIMLSAFSAQCDLESHMTFIACLTI
jgi:hypothetical protein